MRRKHNTWVVLLLTVLTAFTGCHPLQPFYLQEDGDLSHLLQEQLKPEYPDVDHASLPDATSSRAPLTNSNPNFDDFWDLSLEEVVHITLQNSKVIRNLGGVTPIGFADGLVQRTGSSTVYDPAITASSASAYAPARTGAGITISSDQANRISAGNAGGTESALSAFDTQVSIVGTDGGAILSKTDAPLNTTGAFPGFPVVTQADDGGLRFDVAKKTASGLTVSANSSSIYERGNRRGTFQALNSTWTQIFELKAEHHLLQGRGTQINRIPIVLARLNEDISLTGFEIAVRNALLDVENTYWDLHYAYRSLEAAKEGSNAAQWAWQKIQARREGAVDPADAEAQARSQYWSFRARTQAAQQNVLELESRLRFLMGIAPTDGRLIRPIDEPTVAKVEFDWTAANCEALVRRAELRQQKWQLKQRELELIAARNRLLPVLDVGAAYRWLGVGDELLNADRNGINFPLANSTAWDELTEGNFQEFDLFFSFAMPVGYRRELAAVQNARLQIVRTKAVLEDAELNTSHLLSSSLRSLDGNYVQSQTNLNRLQAADKWVEVITSFWGLGGAPARDTRLLINQLLNAINDRAAAYDEMYRSVCEYNKAIANVHFMKGSLLEYNGVQLAEGPWPKKAYWDALGRARERDASYYFNYGWTRPGVISRGSAGDHVDEKAAGDAVEGAPGDPQPKAADGDMLPVPNDEIDTDDGNPRTARQSGPLLRSASTEYGAAGDATPPVVVHRSPSGLVNPLRQVAHEEEDAEEQ